ncbi:MAG: hypothetical protein WCJ30_04605 [Deltaproteobacteria bacterium]
MEGRVGLAPCDKPVAVGLAHLTPDPVVRVRAAPRVYWPAMGEGFSAVSRRRFLRVSLGVGGVVLMGSSTAVLGLGGWARAVPGMRQLSDREYRTLAALAEAMFPHGGPFVFSAYSVDLARAFDRYLVDEPDYVRTDLSRALFLLEWGPVIDRKHARTFSRLREEQRLAFFRGWAEGEDETRRQVSVAFRKFLSMVFYDNPGVWPAIGYRGPSLLSGDHP